MTETCFACNAPVREMTAAEITDVLTYDALSGKGREDIAAGLWRVCARCQVVTPGWVVSE